MDDAVSHQVLLWAIGGLGSVCVIEFTLIISILRDHVRRDEYDAVVRDIKELSSAQAQLIARHQDDRERLVALEHRLVSGLHNG